MSADFWSGKIVAYQKHEPQVKRNSQALALIRKKLVVQRRRGDRACKGAAGANETFCGIREIACTLFRRLPGEIAWQFEELPFCCAKPQFSCKGPARAKKFATTTWVMIANWVQRHAAGAGGRTRTGTVSLPVDFEFYRLRGNEWTVIPYGGP